MSNRSKLLKLRVINVGCIGPDGVEIALDNIVFLVGKNNAGKSSRGTGPAQDGPPSS